MQELYKINNYPSQFKDSDVFHKLAQQFLPFAQERLKFDKPVSINLLSDPNNAKNPLGKTAYYDPGKMEVTVFVDKRHVKDILRSLSHELVHHKQNCRGEFDKGINTSDGYAQDDEHMRKCEGEAYLHGSGFLFRDWEDNLNKENQVMTTEAKEIKDLDEGTGKLCEDCGKMHEGSCEMHEDSVSEEKIDEGELPPGLKNYQDKNKKLSEKDDDDDDEGENDGENDGEDVNQNENWFKGNKDQLLFERLTKLWTK